MRILGIADIVTKEMIEKGFNEHLQILRVLHSLHIWPGSPKRPWKTLRRCWRPSSLITLKMATGPI